MSRPACHWMVIVVNLVKQTWCLACLLVWSCVFQYQIFPPLAAIIATRCHGMLATRHCRHSMGIYVHSSSRTCQYWWLHDPIHSKYVLWGCSLAILQAAPSWWHCLAEGNQGLPERGEVLCYRFGSGSHPQNTDWKMALRCFAECPCRDHP